MIGEKNGGEMKALAKICLVVLLPLLLLTANCSSTDSAAPSDELYFPLQKGRYWIYDIEETNTLRLTCTDDGVTVSRYELKVTVTDSFPNSELEGGYSYVLQRMTRSSASQPWQPTATWSSKVVKSQALNNESNVTYLKLVFPLYEGREWDGNLYNNETQLNGNVEDTYKATLVSKPYTVKNMQTFDKTVTVVQNDQQKNQLYRDSRLEVYALKVGLVYKESYLLRYIDNSQLPCYAQNVTQQGTVIKQTLKEFGKN